MEHASNFIRKLYNLLWWPWRIDDQPEPPTISRNATDVVRPDEEESKQKRLFMIGICFASIGIAFQALQTPKPLPLSFNWCCMALELCFAALTVSVYMKPYFEEQSVIIVENAGVFFGATAFVLAITMNFNGTEIIRYQCR
ncbi:hypothetical protein M9H77_24443 [Catharanthus roseus]|uniref:Uncharacterized protein n=1 Tax=Catharanthus roseus TaxID=4058 RepID=A0ACC0AXV8_CATRO|nr:hypothetical protein M9H77_24443 [Catharanthus roseus]